MYLEKQHNLDVIITPKKLFDITKYPISIDISLINLKAVTQYDWYESKWSPYIVINLHVSFLSFNIQGHPTYIFLITDR